MTQAGGGQAGEGETCRKGPGGQQAEPEQDVGKGGRQHHQLHEQEYVQQFTGKGLSPSSQHSLDCIFCTMYSLAPPPNMRKASTNWSAFSKGLPRWQKGWSTCLIRDKFGFLSLEKGWLWGDSTAASQRLRGDN